MSPTKSPPPFVRPVQKVSVASPDLADPSPLSRLLEEAEVCCEQAREAGRLKRFRSALGLFATANALCRHVASNGDEAQIALAKERLQGLAHESAIYGELARGARRSSH